MSQRPPPTPKKILQAVLAMAALGMLIAGALYFLIPPEAMAP